MRLLLLAVPVCAAFASQSAEAASQKATASTDRNRVVTLPKPLHIRPFQSTARAGISQHPFLVGPTDAQRHERWCLMTHPGYRRSDNSYPSTLGRRLQCVSPYGP